MDEISLKQLIKNVRNNTSVIIFVLGFIIVILFAFNLFLSSSLRKNSSGKITDQAASIDSTTGISQQIGVNQVLNVGHDGFQIQEIEDSVSDNYFEPGDESTELLIYFAKEGDSTWKIAEEVLGDGQRYVEIEDLNEFAHNQKLEVGQMVLVVKGSSQDGFEIDESIDFQTEQVEEYTIQSGDCLWNIASQHLNDPYRWPEIYELNKEVIGSNPDLIYSGTQLQLPKL